MRLLTRCFLRCLPLLLLTACLTDEHLEQIAPVDGFSDPADLSFSAAEYETLSEVLDVDRRIDASTKSVPAHLAFGETLDPVLERGAAAQAFLGRVLFYDTQLSATGETSCASCHKQELAFADDVTFSKGINGQFTKRNSLGLASVPSFSREISGYGETDPNTFVANAGRVNFFWDERAATISEQSVLTIEDELEMGSDLVELSNRLRQQEIYQILSVKAYGTTELTPDRITLALEKFCSSISAMDTRFDRMADLEFFGDRTTLEREFSASELRGRDLYLDNCASCHGRSLGEPFITVTSNGLDEYSVDPGLGGIHQAARFQGIFKVPFLRNAELTAPYMHDGRFETLREVIEHYSSGIQDAPNLDFRLREGNNPNLPPLRMNFSEEDIDALLAFFALTTDETVATEKRLSNPFRQ